MNAAAPAEREALDDKALKPGAERAQAQPLCTNPVICACTGEVDVACWADGNPRFYLAR